MKMMSRNANARVQSIDDFDRMLNDCVIRLQMQFLYAENELEIPHHFSEP